MAFDGKQFGAEIVAAVKSHVADTLAPIMARLDAIEAKLAAPPAVSPAAIAEVRACGEELRKAIDDLPMPVEPPALPDIPAMVKEAVAALPAPQDGKSVTVDDVRPLIDEAVQKAVSVLPKAKDGEPGKDGVGLAGAILSREGGLVLTLTDGTTRDLGIVVGKDADMVALRADVERMVAAIPKPKDGADGVGFDDLDLIEGQDGVHLRFARGETVKQFRLPVVIDRGVYREGSYHKGDGVTYGGSFWISQEDGNGEKPDSGKGWRLAVKRGRDGKDAVPKPEKAREPLRIG
jgi:hypothetical protein